jgi:trans-aconitate methyltransferase
LDSDDFTAIAHEGLAFMNPLAEEDVEEMIEALELEPGAHVLDLGCGKAEILLRIVERYPDVRATGLDKSAAVLAEARRQSETRVPESKVVLLEEDVREYAPEPGAFDLVVSTGGVSFRGGVGGTLAVLSGYVASGGKLLFGEGYWREEPTAEYLVALGAAREELKDYEGTIEAAVEAGLDLKRAVTSSVDDWDAYEDAWARNGERYAEKHEGEEGVAELREWIANGRARYGELGGREILGFGLFLFAEVPGPGPGRQQQENLRSAVAPDRMAFVRLEVGERARGSLDLAVGARHPYGAFDDEEPGVLLDLMVAELLPRIEADEDRPRLVLALQDDRRTGARRSRDLGEPPALHSAPV